MVKSVEGIYRNGKVELLESLAEAEGSRVVVPWVSQQSRSIFVNVGSTSLRPPICGAAWLRLPRTGIDLKWLPTMNCRRGDVLLVLFPDSNLRTSERRPALVVQADQLGAGLPQTIVAMITSNMARAGHTSRVVVRVDSESAKGQVC